ncbi:MAG TPA: LytTR family DNA-binding domain-containing protein [Gemmatimonadaceae bacterium]|nr:LytTR family DNA-binding domain-containing protein [Gemmatimonadaceae bacterium]
MKRPSAVLLGARTWLLCFAAATALGTTLAWQRWSAWRSQGKPPFWSAEYIQPQLIPWYSWAVIAPLLMLALHHVASLDMTKWRRIMAYVGLAVLAISLQAVVQGLALGWWWSFPNLIPRDPTWHIVDQLKSRSTMSVLVVWVIGAMYHATMRARTEKVDLSPALELPPPAPTTGPIALKAADRVWFVAPSEIEWVEADGDYVIVHTAKGKHRIRETISAFEMRLPSDQLVRVSRSSIVNIASIKEMQRWFRGNYVVILRNGTKVTTGARYRDRLTRRIGQ